MSRASGRTSTNCKPARRSNWPYSS
jgi:hypothetical protein